MDEKQNKWQPEQPLVTVDVVIFTLVGSNLQVLLVKRSNYPDKNHWAIPGGFVDKGEELEVAALRELKEETGVEDLYLEQLYTFGDPERDPRGRVITVAYLALVAHDQCQVRAGSDAKEAHWWSMDALPEKLAFDHAEILDYALQRLRYKLEYSAVGFQLLPNEFSLAELQLAYEAVLGEELDKGNFRKRLLMRQVVEPTGKFRQTGGRPAELYRYRDDAVAEVKTRRLFP